MKTKIIAVVVLLALVAGGVAYAVMGTPERKLCVKVGELCGAEGDLGDLEKCVEQVEEIEKLFGEEPVEQAATCVEGADTCVEAMGCLTAAGMKTMQEQMGEFFEGLRRGLEGKK